LRGFSCCFAWRMLLLVHNRKLSWCLNRSKTLGFYQQLGILLHSWFHWICLEVHFNDCCSFSKSPHRNFYQIWTTMWKLTFQYHLQFCLLIFPLTPICFLILIKISYFCHFYHLMTFGLGFLEMLYHFLGYLYFLLICLQQGRVFFRKCLAYPSHQTFANSFPLPIVHYSNLHFSLPPLHSFLLPHPLFFYLQVFHSPYHL